MRQIGTDFKPARVDFNFFFFFAADRGGRNLEDQQRPSLQKIITYYNLKLYGI